MKRSEDRDGSNPGKFGRRNIIAAAAKKTQAIQERKLREQQEEQATIELKKRKEQRQREVHTLKGRQSARSQREMQEADKQTAKKLAGQNKSATTERQRTAPKPCSTGEKKIEQTNPFFCEEMTEEIERLKCNQKEKREMEIQSIRDSEKYIMIDQDERKLLEKISRNDNEAQRIFHSKRNLKLAREKSRQSKQDQGEPKATENHQKMNQPINWEFPKPNKNPENPMARQAEGEKRVMEELKDLQSKCPKVVDSNGRPDCSTPCASSSESEGECFYRRMAGRYRETRYSILEFMRTGIHAHRNDEDEDEDEDKDDPVNQDNQDDGANKIA